jgi:hypothetical protein
MVLLKVVHPLKIYQHTKCHSATLVEVLHPPQNFECPPFWNGLSCRITNYCVEVTFNGMSGSKVVEGCTYRKQGDLISQLFPFRKESKLEIGCSVIVQLVLCLRQSQSLSCHTYLETRVPWMHSNVICHFSVIHNILRTVIKFSIGSSLHTEMILSS